MDWGALGYFMGAVLAAIIAGGFGIYNSHISRQTRAQVTPTNGTKTAAIVELIRDDQIKIAQELGAQRQKVDEVAATLATEQVEVEQERARASAWRAEFTEHLKDDQVFQTTVERFWAPLAPMMLKAAAEQAEAAKQVADKLKDVTE